MISLIQLVTHAKVTVSEQIVGAISLGILALIGIEKNDTLSDAQKLIHRIIHYRIFKDAQGKTNLSLQDVQGGLLLVPQFTLVADTQSGMRPSFSKGMPPADGKILFQQLVDYAKTQHSPVATGEFGADMDVTLCNRGPMTFILSTH